MTPFDEQTTTTNLQLMKLLLPYFPGYFRKTFAFYIKFAELQNTLKYFTNVNTFTISTLEPSDILEDLRPYMAEQDLNSIDSILSMLNMMEMLKTMEGDFMPDMFGFADNQNEQEGKDENERK